MTTKSFKPVTRESSALVRERGMRPVIVTIVGGVIELRAKGLRSREIVDVSWAWAAKQLADFHSAKIETDLVTR